MYSDPAFDSRPALLCFRFQRIAWSSVVLAIRQSTEWLSSRFFYVKRWITVPEVDSRLSGVSASHLFFASPEEYMIGIFLEDVFWYVSVFGTPWFDSGYMLGVSCDCAFASMVLVLVCLCADLLVWATIVLSLSVVLVLMCLCADTPIWAAIVLSLSVVLVLVCLCVDTPIWARIAFSLSLVGSGVHCRLRYGDVGKDCAFALLVLVLVFIPVVAQGSSGAVVEKTVYIPQMHLVLGCRRGEDGRDPTVATSMLDSVAHMPVVSQRQVPGMVETVQ